MQILTRLNKVIAHSEFEYIPVGNSAVCPVTGECYDDALITTVDCVPTDIDQYEYHYIDNRFIKGGVSVVAQIREQNSGANLTFWVGTTAQYNALAEIVDNCFYIITDDTSITDVQDKCEEIATNVSVNTEKINAHNDFVESQGTLDNWTFRKWGSGIVECWGKFRHTIPITKEVSNSNFYRSDIITELLPAGLFTSVTAVDITDTRNVDDAVYLSRVKLATATKVEFCYLRAGTSSSTATFDTYIMVKGTWE